MVFAPLVSVLLASLSLGALGGQVPHANGAILGSVRPALSLPKKSFTSTSNAAHAAGSLRVTENPSICETTPGVYSASGYGDVSADAHLWFWFFAARNSPSTAPFTIWLSGGPGASSMSSLFTENGPCRIKNDSSGVDLNPMSWNEVSNILYIDQPVGVGFSYGDLVTSTSQEAAAVVWTFLQIFFADSRFSQYATRDFAIWTESYGGHYGPIFTAYFLDQNAAITAGTIQGIPINLKVLGIGNGLTDPISQYPSFVSYSLSNPYHQLTDTQTITKVNESYYAPGRCRDLIVACNQGLNDSVCSIALNYCNSYTLFPLVGNYDVYYVLSLSPDPYPADITKYMNSTTVTAAIGAQATWSDMNYTVYENFAYTGDWMKSSIGNLEKVINAGVRTMLYDGDADYLCNYMGFEAMISNLNTSMSSLYASQPWTQWTVNGTVAGQYKNAGTFSYVRVYQAGHEVPAYTVGNLASGQHALTFFTQIMSGKQISST